MYKRYLQVLGLYTLSTLIPNILCQPKNVKVNFKQWLMQNILGYGIFAYGLHILSKLKK
ncbi:hypothetical protein SAP2_05830 [Staphylococcus arlettae]|nr:hypothetical protein N039_05895 [Staphylococcus sp. EGD-HP3]BBK27399.1 hypothetical protein SAP2_05830 [Staphylococcus arlettae]